MTAGGSLFLRALGAQAVEVAPMDPRRVEFVECLLYEHVATARRARLQMDRMAWCIEYADLYQQREAAIEQAKKHLRTLRAAGVPIDPLLASMLTAEEIQP